MAAATITYPVECSLGHAAVNLTDDAALTTHYTSVHSATPIADYKVSLAKGKTVAAPSPPTKPKTSLDPLATMGLTIANLSKFSIADLSGSGRLTPPAFQGFLDDLGEKLGNIAIDKDRFTLDFFRFILNHGGTNKLKGLGGLALADSSTSEVRYLSWEEFHLKGSAYFENFNFLFTMRRLQDMYESVFWAIWNNPLITALDDIKQEGTPRSRDWVMAGGSPVPAYVLVPGLFSRHLTAGERDVRKLQSRVVKLDQEGAAVVEYVGLGGQDDVQEAQVSEAQARNSMKMSRLWSGSGLAGLADSNAPRPWENPKTHFQQ